MEAASAAAGAARAARRARAAQRSHPMRLRPHGRLQPILPAPSQIQARRESKASAGDVGGVRVQYVFGDLGRAPRGTPGGDSPLTPSLDQRPIMVNICKPRPSPPSPPSPPFPSAHHWPAAAALLN